MTNKDLIEKTQEVAETLEFLEEIFKQAGDADGIHIGESAALGFSNIINKVVTTVLSINNGAPCYNEDWEIEWKPVVSETA